VSLQTRHGRVSRWFSSGKNRTRSCRTGFAGSQSPLDPRYRSSRVPPEGGDERVDSRFPGVAKQLPRNALDVPPSVTRASLCCPP
jgi:hypothetical protein